MDQLVPLSFAHQNGFRSRKSMEFRGMSGGVAIRFVLSRHGGRDYAIT